MMNTICELCQEEPKMKGYRYCKTCRTIKLVEMKNAGYLTTGGYGHVGQSRTQDQKEVQYETKHGTGHW